MWDCEFEDFVEILSACDFSQAAIEVFKRLQLTDVDRPISSDRNALTFAFNNLPPDLVLIKDERETLASIAQVAHLFDIVDFEVVSPIVRFFSVNSLVRQSERSQVQYTVHSMIARKAPYCSVAILRNGEAVSLSVSYHMTSKIKTIFLSDWYELFGTELKYFMEVIGTALVSSYSGVEFASDFIYLVARDYYIHPLSYEYMRYELNSDEGFLVHIVEEYGYDFVADTFIESYNRDVDTTDEIDFDLIEYELEQIDFVEQDEIDDEEVLSDFSQTEEIPKEVMADPVLLLKWLDERSSEKSPETDSINSEILDLINSANIDYIDHRDKGGCLWIFGEYELEDFVEKCKEFGIVFHFKEGGGKATDGFDAWWCR